MYKKDNDDRALILSALILLSPRNWLFSNTFVGIALCLMGAIMIFTSKMTRDPSVLGMFLVGLGSVFIISAPFVRLVKIKIALLQVEQIHKLQNRLDEVAEEIEREQEQRPYIYPKQSYIYPKQPSTVKPSQETTAKQATPNITSPKPPVEVDLSKETLEQATKPHQSPTVVKDNLSQNQNTPKQTENKVSDELKAHIEAKLPIGFKVALYVMLMSFVGIPFILVLYSS